MGDGNGVKFQFIMLALICLAIGYASYTGFTFGGSQPIPQTITLFFGRQASVFNVSLINAVWCLGMAALVKLGC